MRIGARRGQAVVIATLIMISASMLLTTLVLYWGLSIQGQSLTNFGSAIARGSNAAEEDISIDSMLFLKTGSSPNTYAAIVYVRNFGNTPVRLAGIHLQNLQSGAAIPAYDCEVTQVVGSIQHMVIVARAMLPVSLSSTVSANPSPPPPKVVTVAALTYPVGGWCSVGIPNLSSSWDGATIRVMVTTEAGTIYQANFLVPT